MSVEDKNSHQKSQESGGAQPGPDKEEYSVSPGLVALFHKHNISVGKL